MSPYSQHVCFIYSVFAEQLLFSPSIRYLSGCRTPASRSRRESRHNHNKQEQTRRFAAGIRFCLYNNGALRVCCRFPQVLGRPCVRLSG